MATKRQLRVLARNLAAKLLIQTNFDTGRAIPEKDVIKFENELRRVAYSIVSKCYKSPERVAEKIATDVFKKVK